MQHYLAADEDDDVADLRVQFLPQVTQGRSPVPKGLVDLIRR